METKAIAATAETALDGYIIEWNTWATSTVNILTGGFTAIRTTFCELNILIASKTLLGKNVLNRKINHSILERILQKVSLRTWYLL